MARVQKLTRPSWYELGDNAAHRPQGFGCSLPLRSKTMNAAEEVVTRWLLAKGYFVMPSVKDGRKEIDILAVRLAEDKKGFSEKLHVEVQVSPNPFHTNYADEDYRAGADDYVAQKFTAVSPKVKEILGEGYACWLVIGKLGGGEREERTRAKRFNELGVRTVTFDRVLREYAESLMTRPADNAGQLLHILSAYGMLNIGAEH